MLTLRGTVFDAPVMGTVTVYSEPTWDGGLATADKLLIQATTAQAAGTTRKLTIDLERSNDRESWVVETTLIGGQSLSTTTTESWFGQDLGTGTVPGCFRRLALYFTDSGASAHVRVVVAGRTRRSEVMRRAASAASVAAAAASATAAASAAAGSATAAAAGAAPAGGKAGCSCSGGCRSSGTAASARPGPAPPQLRGATFAAPPLRLSAGPALCGSPRVPECGCGGCTGLPPTATSVEDPAAPRPPSPSPPPDWREAPLRNRRFPAPARLCRFTCGGDTLCHALDRCWNYLGRINCAPDREAACRRFTQTCLGPPDDPSNPTNCVRDRPGEMLCLGLVEDAGRPTFVCDDLRSSLRLGWLYQPSGLLEE